MTNTQKTILAFLSVIACALLGLVSYYGLQTYQFYAQQPLGPALPNPQIKLMSLPPTWTTSPAPETTPSPAYTLAPTLSLIADTPLSAARCGGPNVMTLLAIGTDARSNTYNYGLADVIRLVRVDFVTPKVTVLELPRDLWVQIPEIADDIGQDHEKLNQAYLYGNPGFGYYKHPSAGPGLLALTLDLNFGVHPDHYGAINMRTFENIVNAVGGIDVNLPETVDGRTADDMNKRLLFLSGIHHLNGEQALTLARIRIEGVFERASNQNRVLCALRDKLTRPEVVTKIPDLIASFKNNVQTDLSPEQIGQLACVGTQFRSQDIVFATFPEELFKQARVYDPVFKKRVFVWDVDLNILRDYISQFNAGTWPNPGLEPPDQQPAFVCP